MVEENQEHIDYHRMAQKMTREDKDNIYTFIEAVEENGYLIPKFKVDEKTKNG